MDGDLTHARFIAYNKNPDNNNNNKDSFFPPCGCLPWAPFGPQGTRLQRGAWDRQTHTPAARVPCPRPSAGGPWSWPVPRPADWPRTAGSAAPQHRPGQGLRFGRGWHPAGPPCCRTRRLQKQNQSKTKAKPKQAKTELMWPSLPRPCEVGAGYGQCRPHPTTAGRGVLAIGHA